MKIDELKTYYHAAPARVRDSIEQHGLDASKAPYERSTSGSKLYVFADLDEALWYARTMARTDPREDFDVWELKPTRGAKIVKDYSLRSTDEGDDTAYELTGEVPRSQVKLLRTVS